MRLLEPGKVEASALDPRWRPMLVTAIVQEPVVTYGDGLDLDGPLSYGAYQRYIDEGSPDGELDSGGLHLKDWADDFDLPLARWEAPLSRRGDVDARLLAKSGKLWGWCCSAVQAQWGLHGAMEVRKMPAVAEMAKLTTSPSFHPGMGTQKAYDLKFPTRFPVGGRLEWYALGDPDAVRSLLMEVPAIGKKVNQGNGRLMIDANALPRWTVDEIDEASRDWWLMRDGALMRQMPASFAPARRSRRSRLRSPYWHHSRKAWMVEVDHG